MEKLDSLNNHVTNVTTAVFHLTGLARKLVKLGKTRLATESMDSIVAISQGLYLYLWTTNDNVSRHCFNNYQNISGYELKTKQNKKIQGACFDFPILSCLDLLHIHSFKKI